jgi:hypothetical protein
MRPKFTPQEVEGLSAEFFGIRLHLFIFEFFF